MTLKHLQHEAHKVRMTPAEKSAMRVAIFGTPSAVTTSTASPYFFFDFQFMTRALAAVLLVLLVGGGGVAYAAEGSLPGQPLYAVKVNVTEPIQTALATNPAARAAVHVELAQRRVEEAEALASQGTLDATTTQELEQNFEQHAQSADELAVEVGATDPSAAVEIKAELASSLGVHGALLATLAGENKSSDTKANSARLASRVIARANAAAGITTDNETASASASATAAKVVATAAPAPTQPRVQTMRTFAAKTGATATPTEVTDNQTSATEQQQESQTPVATTFSTTATNTAASSSAGSSNDESSPQNKSNSELKGRAQDALGNAKSTYDDAKSKFDAATVASLDSQFAEVQSDISAGNFTDALKLALRLQVIIKAQANYRTNIITPLLQLQLNTNNSVNENHRGSWNHGDSNDDH